MSDLLRRAALVSCLALSSSALAQGAPATAPAPAAAPTTPAAPPPSADEIKRFLDYQENGKERGPALMDVIPCTKVDQTKGSPTAFQCIEPVTGPLKKNAAVMAWVQFFCPKDGKYEDLAVQFLLEGQVRNTYDLTVAGYGRTRTWKGANLGKAGKWTIKVLRGAIELGSATVVVEN